ncbi:MAG: ATP-binding cassette domain-containing protein [Deltaproteobacteria bacterium]|nr:ATP-binding cassette domain-containing protein [Deltaproteobacteria bacterium]
MAAPPEMRLGIGAVVGRALGYWRPHALSGIALLGLLLVQQGYGALIAYTLKDLVDRAIPGHDGVLVVWLVGGLAAGYVLAAAAMVAAEYLTARVAGAILNELRGRMFRHLQRLSLAWFGGRHAADIAARFSGDLADLEKGVTVRLVDGALAVAGLAVYLPFLFALDPGLAALVAAGLPVMLLWGRVFSPRAADARLELRREEGEMASAVAENVRLQPVVKLFGLAEREVAGFESRLARVRRLYVRSSYFAALVGATSSLGVLAFQALVLGVGSWLALDGRIAVGTLVAFVALHASVSKQAYDLAKKVVPSLISASGGLVRIEEILSEVPGVDDAPGARPLPGAPADIRFEDVTFGYEPGQPKLDHLTLTLPARRTVAIVGPSGSGKSTVLRLALRFYDVQGGRVTVAGRDVREVTLASLHGRAGVVFQDPFLFDGTLLDNIAVGRPGATREEIERAARAAELHDAVLAMPGGYDTRVGEFGAQLSGGERQRVAIARAILRDPALLVLDEATAALDPASEAAINATIARLGGERAIVMVTHRLASARDADRIVVLAGGRLAEEGRHEELLERGGLYAELWRKQSGVEVSPEGRGATVKLEWLRDLPLLAGAGDEVLRAVSHDLDFERFDAGRVVFHRGEAGDRFYIVARGKVEIVAGERRIAVLDDGDFFGEMALVEDVPRMATVRTLTPCAFLTLGHARFARLMERFPAFRAQVRGEMARRHAGEGAS